MSCRYGNLPALLALLALLPGCAALVNGPTQDIVVQTSPPGAQCVMTRENAVIATIPQTPAMVRVNRSPAEILVECRRDGHGRGRHRMRSSADGMTLGNVVGAGLMGMGIDSATHSDKSYDGVITVPLPPSASDGEDRQAAASGPLPAGDVSQASWVAQRTAAANASNQTYTVPVGYVPPPVPAQKPDEAKAETKPAEKPLAAALAAKSPPSPSAKPVAVMKPAPSSGGSGLWRVHLASHRTEGAAINEWQELLKKDPRLYGAFDPKIEWVDLKDRGSFARLLLGGWPERKEADAACAKIRGPGRYCAAVRD